MNRATASNGGAGWTKQTFGGDIQTPQILLLRQDAALSASPRLFAVPETPVIVRDARHAPVFSLTLLLSRLPEPQETTVFDLIQQGFLSCDLSLALTPALRSAVSQQTGSACEPLFARSASLWMTQAGQEIANTRREMGGTDLRAGFSLTLDRIQSLAVLDALDGANGTPTGITVQARLTYRMTGSSQVVTLSGAWARVYDFLITLQETPGKAVILSREMLMKALPGMVTGGILTLTRSSKSAAQKGAILTEAEAALLLPDFLMQAGLILERLTPEHALNDSDNRYGLRDYPPEGYRFQIQRTLPAAETEETLELSALLDDLLPDLLDGQDRNAFLHLIAPDGVTGLGPVPNRVKSQPRLLSRDTEVGPIALAARDGQIRAISTVMRPNILARPATSALLHSDTVLQTPSASERLRQWQIQDPIFVPEKDPLENLPRVDDQTQALWQDRKDSSRWWFAPTYSLVLPALNADPASSPFLFSYRQVGTTVDGKPAIEATIQFTLQRGMSDAAKAALQAAGNPAAQPVPPLGLSAALEIPFLDQTNGLRTQRFDGVIETQGDQIVVTVSLINDWARLGYGALAVAGFQSQPARLVLSYSYRAYVPLPRNRFILAFGGRASVTPIRLAQDSGQPLLQRAVVNAANLEIRTPVTTMRFQPERPANLPSGPVASTRPTDSTEARLETRLPAALSAGTAFAVRPVALNTTVLNRPIAGAAVKPSLRPAVFVPRPDLAESSVLQQLLQKTEYVIQTLAAQQMPVVSVPCNTLGTFYRREDDSGSVAVGCQDALQLGKTVYRQYEEISELRDPLYTAYRSLQQPGRFLILPTAYRITRYAAADPVRPFHPVIMLHASLDAEHPEHNQYVYEATMEADLPPYARRLLLDRLRAHAQDPILVYPTEIESEAAYSWTLAVPNVLHSEVKIPEGFWMSFATGMDSAPLLQSLLEGGISGTVTFTLPDGVALISRLELDLRKITGPWETGPVSVTLQNDAATLTNRIERSVAVSDLNVYDSAGTLHSVAANATLAASGAAEASVTIPLPAGIEAQEGLPVTLLIPGGPVQPEETDAFAEAITTNVIFINLLSYANHNLTQVSILARLKGVEQTYPVPTDETQRVSQLMLTLPLTTYQQNQTVQFQITKTFNDGQSATTDWMEQDLSQSHIISIVWNLIQ